MDTFKTLDAFAKQVVTEDEERWLPGFVEAVRGLLPNDPDAALLIREESGWVSLAAAGDPPDVTQFDLTDNTQQDGEFVLLPLPCVSEARLWIRTTLSEEEAEVKLAGWLAVAGSGLARAQQERELSKQIAARDHFFSMVNHDLKSPLSSIKAMADLIVRKIERGTLDPATGEGRDDLLERLNFLSTRVKDMAMLIDKIGDVSNIERGRLFMNFQKTDLASVLESSVERIEDETGRTINVGREGHGFLVNGDPGRFAQVFHILLKNATDYSEPESPIRIALSARSQQVDVEIRDHGLGIEAAQLDRLGKEYGRVVQNAPSGLGVGLYVASALVNAHGGTLKVESEPGEGTRVLLSFPLAETSAESAPRRTTQPSRSFQSQSKRRAYQPNDTSPSWQAS